MPRKLNTSCQPAPEEEFAALLQQVTASQNANDTSSIAVPCILNTNWRVNALGFTAVAIISHMAYGITNTCLDISDTIRQTLIYVMFTNARMSQGLFEIFIPTARPNTTPIPSRKNQDVNKSVAKPRIAMIAKSCMAPQTMNVIMTAAALGKIRISGVYTNLNSP